MLQKQNFVCFVKLIINNFCFQKQGTVNLIKLAIHVRTSSHALTFGNQKTFKILYLMKNLFSGI